MNQRIEKSDEIDWKIVDQLHQAVSKISNDCFEYKKLCVTVVAAVIALMVRFGAENNLGLTLIVCVAVCLGFWIADATAYFYQRKLRRAMTSRINDIAMRNKIPTESQIDAPSLPSSVLNPSMVLYIALLIIFGCVWLVF